MSRPFLIGLTGSIGMGKSTTATMFADHGVAVWDADAAVHRLYAPGGAGAKTIEKLAPEAIRDGQVDRAHLSAWIGQGRDRLQQIEKIIHPLVAADRADFIAGSKAPIVLLDIPLLFETGADADMDLTVTVSAPVKTQRARVLARPGMSEAKLETIRARQMPDAEKRARADHVIDTSDLESARAGVQKVMNDVQRRLADA